MNGQDVIDATTNALILKGIGYWVALGFVGQVLVGLGVWRSVIWYKEWRRRLARKHIMAESGSISATDERREAPWTVDDARMLRYVYKRERQREKDGERPVPLDSGERRVE